MNIFDELKKAGSLGAASPFVDKVIAYNIPIGSSKARVSLGEEIFIQHIQVLADATYLDTAPIDIGGQVRVEFYLNDFYTASYDRIAVPQDVRTPVVADEVEVYVNDRDGLVEFNGYLYVLGYQLKRGYIEERTS